MMKRWGFAGAPASHGTSLVHRHAGSTGARQVYVRVGLFSLFYITSTLEKYITLLVIGSWQSLQGKENGWENGWKKTFCAKS